MTFSFKGPTLGLACAWTIHFKRCQCEEFGSHTVLWLISHFYLFLTVRRLRNSLAFSHFFFQFFSARVWSFLTCFLKKGKQADEQSLKKGLWSWCSSNLGHVLSFLTWWWVILPGICWFMLPGVVIKRKCIVQSSSAGYSPNSVLVWNQIFLL